MVSRPKLLSPTGSKGRAKKKLEESGKAAVAPFKALASLALRGDRKSSGELDSLRGDRGDEGDEDGDEGDEDGDERYRRVRSVLGVPIGDSSVI